MKIAYLANSDLPSRAANSVHVMKMCQAFAKNGHAVTLYARASEDEGAANLFEFYAVEPIFAVQTIAHTETSPPQSMLDRLQKRLYVKRTRNYPSFFYRRQLLRSIRTRGVPDLFYARDIGSLAEVSGFGKPLIYEAHRPPANEVKEQREAWVYRQKSFMRLIVISDALRAEYLRLFPDLPHDKVVVAHDGADLLPLTSTPQVSTGQVGRVQIGYVGHLYPGKGMEVIAAIAPQLEDADFHIVGGMEKDLAYWKAVCTMENVHFHGFVPHGQLGKYLTAFDLVLAPFQDRVYLRKGKGGDEISRWMSPLKLFEYMAAGKVIIASDLPVIKEILADGVNARLVPPSCPEAWIRAIRELQTDLAARRSLGRNAQKTLADHFTWQRRAQKVLVPQRAS